MQGPSYFQAKAGRNKRPAPPVESTELKASLAAGCRREALEKLGVKNALRVQQLQYSLAEHFFEWRFMLRQNFSLLCYGYGSKGAVLEKFVKEACTDGGVLVVNGRAHSLSLRGMLLKIISMLRKSGLSSKASGDVRTLLQAIVTGIEQQRLYLLVHGLDGEALRGSEAQAVLAELAALSGVHVVASVDHVNAGLLWDKTTAARFNWLYQDLTTFQPYYAETAAFQPLLSASRGEVEKHSAAVVLPTLVPHARQIFRLLAEHQLENDDSAGMTLHELFKACRERFLVTNELALRGHLNEFRDHQLMQTRRAGDGVEVLHIPMAPEALAEVLQDLA